MATYKNKLSDLEINILNKIEKKETRLKLMSVFSYFKKHSVDNKVNKSIANFFSMYKRYHQDKEKNPITVHSFKKLTYRLIDLKLLKLEKIGKVNTYIIASSLSEKVSKNLSNEKVIEAVENTNVEANISNTEIYNIKLNTNTNTIYTTDSTVAPVELVVKAKSYIKELKLKNKKLISMIISKLRNCMNVNRKGMTRYIETVVAEKVAQFEVMKIEYSKTIAKNKNLKTAKTLNFTNYSQREYDYDSLEEQLLAHYQN